MAITRKPTGQRQDTATKGEERAAEAFIARAGRAAQESDDEGRKVPVTMRYDPDILKRADAAAKRMGITRSAYVHIALSRALDQQQ